MKPFDIEAAKAGEPVVTREGRAAKFLTEVRNEQYPLVFIVHQCDGEETVLSFTREGASLRTLRSRNDLFMRSVEKEGWINIYAHKNLNIRTSSGIVHPTKEAAEENLYRNDIANRVATLKIEWEE